MKSNTWMPFYIGDYLRDTSRLTTCGHGAYILLIIDYWATGKPLPDDDRQLAAITRSTLGEWKKLRLILAQFFIVADGVWRHKRIDAELAKATEIVEKRSSAGKASAAARAQREVNTCSTHVDVSLEQNAKPSPSPSPIKSSLRSDTSNRDNFIEFYQVYPRHEARRDAERAYTAACKRASPETILAGAQRYAEQRAGQDKQFTKLPATWLTRDCWADGEEDERGREQHCEPTDEERQEALIEARKRAGIFVAYDAGEVGVAR